MNRSELIARLAQRLAISIPEASQSVAILLAGITDAIATGKRVEIRGFGTMYAKRRNAKVAMNPATQAKVMVPPKRYVMFRPGAMLRERVMNTGLPKRTTQPPTEHR